MNASLCRAYANLAAQTPHGTYDRRTSAQWEALAQAAVYRNRAAHCQALADRARNAPDGKCRGSTAAQWQAAADSDTRAAERIERGAHDTARP